MTAPAVPAEREARREAPPMLSVSLADAGCTRALAGGKVQTLSALLRAGFPVPDGFALTTWAFAQFISDAGLERELELLTRAISDPDLLPDDGALAPIRARIRAAPLRPELRAQLEAEWTSHFGGDVAMAVRSSASLEDLP